MTVDFLSVIILKQWNLQENNEKQEGFNKPHTLVNCSGQVVVDTFNSDNSNFMGDRSSLAECNLSML